MRHLRAIGKVKKLDSWVPHDLNEKQQSRRMEVASSLLLRNKECNFLDRIITCDEKWIMYNNMHRDHQWLDVDEPPGHFPKPDLHSKKVMITVWWTASGLIHHSFLETGKTITAESYSREIDICYKKLAEKCPYMVNRKGPILLHDNARPHVGKITQKIRRIRQTSHLQLIICSGILTIFSVAKFLTIGELSKRPSIGSLTPERQSFIESGS